MSQVPSPFSLPDQTPPVRPETSRNTVAIIAIIAVTCLLMCGGVVTLGIYAINRAAEQFAELAADEGEWDELQAEVAIEYSLEQNDVLMERVGEIELIESHDGLTYDDDADGEDYYYRIEGTAGNAIVVVQFDEDNDHRWFKSVKLVEGASINAPRTTLSARNAPFDSETSKLIFDILVQNDRSAAQSLDIGSLQWITYQYDNSITLDSDLALLFDVFGENGNVSIKAIFTDFEFAEVVSLSIVDDDGNDQRTIFTADTVDEIDVP